MALGPSSLAALKTEILNDPNTLGYAPGVAAKADNRVAELLNERRDTIDIKRTDVSVSELFQQIDVNDYTALPGTPSTAQLSAERRYLGWLSGLVALGTVRLQNEDGSDTPVTTNLKAMFGVGTATRNRISALMTRKGSRAEQLFGQNVSVSADDVRAALNLP